MRHGRGKVIGGKSVSSRYYMPEAMPLGLCGACLTVVLQSSERARGIYNQIVESYGLPDMQAAFSRLQGELPRCQVRAMWNENVERLKARKLERGWDATWLVPDGDFFRRFAGEATEYSYVFEEWLDSKRDEILSEDFERWYRLIDELIKVGFNNESEQANGMYKVTAASSPLLFFAIHIRAFAEHNGVELVIEGETRAMRISGTTHDLRKLLAQKGTGRKHRVRTRACKKGGYRLRHDDTIATRALWWYLSRVVYSGPEEFCNQMLLQDVDSLHRPNVSNEIRAYDEAIGYPRGK